MIGIDGITLSRVIPKDTLLGLLSGAYSLHGGVVRDMSGQIVSHLAVPSGALSLMPGLGWIADAFQSYQLHTLGLTLNRVESKLGQVMQASMAATAFSGLGLVVSITGFVYLSRKLAAISETLGRIERNTNKTNHLLTAVQYGKLQSAMDNLRHAQSSTDPNTRHSLLMHSKQDFGSLLHEYQHLWSRLEDLEDLDVLESSWTLAMVGHGLATNELDMGSVSVQDFKTHRLEWQQMAREFCRNKVLKDNPQRLLLPRYVEDMPTAELIALLDFSHGTDKGVGWIDELRLRQGGESIFKWPSFGAESASLKLGRQLAAKDKVLDSIGAHFEFLHDQGLRSGAFLSTIQTLADGSPTDSAVWVTVERPAPNESFTVANGEVFESHPETWLHKMQRALGFGRTSFPRLR